MKSEKREILKKDIDWLWKAISLNNTQTIHIGNNSAISLDGYRLHAINPDNLPSNINGIDHKEIIKLFEYPIIPLPSFAINPKYLIDALSGFVPSECGTVTIEVVGDEHFHGIKITSDEGNKIAFIACIIIEEDDDDKSD